METWKFAQLGGKIEEEKRFKGGFHGNRKKPFGSATWTDTNLEQDEKWERPLESAQRLPEILNKKLRTWTDIYDNFGYISLV